MVEQTRICVVGASGLVGSSLIEQSLSRPAMRLVGVSRREVPLPYGARLEMLVADPSGWDDAIAAAGAAVLVCALGTTWKKAGKDEAAFRAVDHDLVLQCARAAKAAGIEHMILVSSCGADPASKHLYLRVKGEIEQAVARLRFRRCDILRPGLLRGERRERRPLEAFASLFAPLVDLFLQGRWRRYRSIDAQVLASAIFALSQAKPAGHFIHEYDALLYAIRRAGG
jgi:uncharacterized protein YbjT (DUF2867 family)